MFNNSASRWHQMLFQPLETVWGRQLGLNKPAVVPVCFDALALRHWWRLMTSWWKFPPTTCLCWLIVLSAYNHWQRKLPNWIWFAIFYFCWHVNLRRPLIETLTQCLTRSALFQSAFRDNSFLKRLVSKRIVHYLKHIHIHTQHEKWSRNTWGTSANNAFSLRGNTVIVL